MAQARVIDVPTRLPLVPIIEDRLTTVIGDTINNHEPDARLINAVLEKEQSTGDLVIRKRLAFGTILYDRALANGTGLGLYSFSLNASSADKLIQIYRTSLTNARFYSDNTLVTTLTVSNSQNYLPFWFETINTNPNNVLFFRDITRGYTFDGTTVTQIVDPDYPGGLVAGIAYLDGTSYVMDVYGNIRGSDINDPTSWDPLNSIQANNKSGAGVAIARHLAYVIAFKRNSTEVFYDAGNSVGSPLTRVPGALILHGCANGNSVKSLGDTVFWLSTVDDAPPQISMMTNLQHKVVSTPAVERLLSGFNDIIGVTAETEVYSLAFNYAGHKYYVLTLNSLNLTLVYDATMDVFYRWMTSGGDHWPISSQAYKYTGELLVQTESFGRVHYAGNQFYSENYLDSALPNLFPVDIYPPNFDAGVDRRKFLSAMRFNTDQVSGSELLVRCSDDDYQSWSNFRRVNLSVKRPVLPNCGSFYRRAYHFRHQSNTSFRIKTVDLQMELGTL